MIMNRAWVVNVSDPKASSVCTSDVGKGIEGRS